MISFPNAKINLGLDIIKKRDDGFHNISSCLYPIPLRDVLEINASDKFSFEITGISIPGDKSHNLVVKAYKLLKNDFDLPNISAHLHKNIPLEAGLGGGSSDGASALRMLSEFFDLFLNDSVLEDYAARLGSDCPFFIYNIPAMISGRGETIDKIEVDLKGYYLYLIKPDIAVSTVMAYQKIQPTSPEYDIRSIISGNPTLSWKYMLKNDFEKVIFPAHPLLSDLKRRLYEIGALYASMTGSGSAIYGIFKDPPNDRNGLPDSYFTWIGKL
jgi:4-diphosphocytidyl-2-C-methyl-D-erythritol kinase